MSGVLALLLAGPAAAQQNFSFDGLHSFDGTASKASGGITAAGNGKLYGVVQAGGANTQGGIFELSQDLAGGDTFRLVYSFTGLTGGINTDGAAPLGTLALSPDGSLLYGTTSAGGAFGQGTLFSVPLPTAGAPNPLPTTLASFGADSTANGFTGQFLRAGVMTFDGAGRLYGIASGGGANFAGQVWKFDGSPHTLYDFGAGATDGFSPAGGVWLGSDGRLWGVTQSGGANSSGTIYNVGTDGSYTQVYPFSASTPNAAHYPVNNDGVLPVGLTPAADGNSFYVITLYGGSNGLGALGQVAVPGGAFTVLGSLPGVDGNGFNTEGALAAGEPVIAPDGGLFCPFGYDGQNNSGTIAQISLPNPANPAATLALAPIFTFGALGGGGSNGDGARPGPISLLPAPAGTGGAYALIGTAAEGGGNGVGGIYALQAPGTPPPLPTVQITADPALIDGNFNGYVTLTWTSANADSCDASRSWQGTEPTAGTQQRFISSDDPNSTSISSDGSVETFDFTLTCTNTTGSAMANAHVEYDVLPKKGGGGGSVDPGLAGLLLAAWGAARRRRLRRC
ncbi:MAG: hypothetical protein ISP90_19070 [Nevskia sp.]|nr:hypothetical protein [Nevskia sp.]